MAHGSLPLRRGLNRGCGLDLLPRRGLRRCLMLLGSGLDSLRSALGLRLLSRRLAL